MKHSHSFVGLMVLIITLCCISLSGAQVRYEAEDAADKSGGTIGLDASASNDSLYDCNQGAYINFSHHASSAVTADLSFRVQSGNSGGTRHMGAFVNGTKIGVLTSSEPVLWETVSFSGVSLPAGDNIIRVEDSEASTELDVDYLEVTETSTGGSIPWNESFDLANGTTSDGGTTSWSATRSAGTFAVQDSRFLINQSGGEGVLTTGNIDISNGPVTMNMDLEGAGGLDPSGGSMDYVRIYQKIDGGSEVMIGEVTGTPSPNPYSFDISGIAGTSLQIVIRGLVTAGDEYYYLDNLNLTEAVNVPAIVTHPASQTVNPGQTAAFSVTATGEAPLYYQWSRNGEVIPSAVSSAYTTPAAVLADDGTVYTVTVSNNNGQVSSNEAVLTVQSNGGVLNSQKIAITAEMLDDQGNPVGYPLPEEIEVTVRLFTDASAGSQVYEETFLSVNEQAVVVEDGLFVARLGEGAASDDLQAVLQANGHLWVELTTEGDTPETLTPRVPLTSAAYSVR